MRRREMDAEQAVANVLGIMMRLHEERSDLKASALINY